MATYILFLDGALLAVVGVGHAGPPADDAAALVGAVVALVTDAHQGAGPHVGVTDHTLAITCDNSTAFAHRMSFLPPHTTGKASWSNIFPVHSKTIQLNCRNVPCGHISYRLDRNKSCGLQYLRVVLNLVIHSQSEKKRKITLWLAKTCLDCTTTFTLELFLTYSFAKEKKPHWQD